MHHQAGRLVDDEDGFILVHHRKRNVFRRLGRQLLVLDFLQVEELAAQQLVLGLLHRLPVEGDPAFPDPGLQAIARILGQQLGQHLIQAAAAGIEGHEYGRPGAASGGWRRR